MSLTLTPTTPGSLSLTQPYPLTAISVHNVKDYGAVGDGSHDDTTAVQLAITTCASLGGGTIWFPRGSYLITASLTLPSFVSLRGVCSPHYAGEYGVDPASVVSEIVLGGAKNFTLLKNSDTSTGNTAIEIHDLRLTIGGMVSDLYAIDFNKVRRSEIKNCTVRGAATTSRIGVIFRNSTEHCLMRDTRLEGCGVSITGSVSRVILDTCEIGAGGVSISGGFDNRVIGCDLYCNGVSSPYPWTTAVAMISTTEAKIIGNSIVAFLNDGVTCSRSVVGSTISDNTITGCSTQTAGVWAGICLESDTPASATTANLIMGNRCYDRLGGSGTQAYGIRIISSSGAQTNNNQIVGNDFRGNKTDGISQTAGLVNLIRDNDGSAIPSITSAATITIPAGCELANVTSTTTITSVTAGFVGQRVTLVFAGILTFTDGSNLKLAGNFVTTADDTITLICDGVNWNEIARSVN